MSDLDNVIAVLFPDKPKPVYDAVPTMPAGAPSIERARAYLAKLPPAISGSGGHDATFAAAVRLKGFGLSENEIFELLRSDYNPRCQPQWSDYELRHKAKDAANGRVPSGYKLNDRGWRALRTASVADGDEPAWDSELLRKRNSRGEDVIENCLYNVELVLRCHPEWLGVLAYDDFSNKIVFRAAAPYERFSKNFSDFDITATLCWIERNTPLRPSYDTVFKAISSSAEMNRFSAVQEYLGQLHWDGVPRLNTWLVDVFGADDTAYTRAVASKWMISAVARAYKPGCKVDHVLILEGEQNLKKSRTLSLLCPNPEWFSDRLSEFGTKAQAEEIEGRWIIELAELDGFGRAEINRIKAFVTRDTENYRPAYARTSIQSPRKCVFAGTINPGSDGYLRDETGNRRFWPVLCHNKAQDLDEQLRDQLWAEAVYRYQAGEIWWPEEGELIKEITEQQEARGAVDVWHEMIQEFLLTKLDISIDEILGTCLNITPEQWDERSKQRVGRCIQKLGWVKYRWRRPTDQRLLWRYKPRNIAT